MKKLITILCAVLITIGLSAQTDQGSMYAGVSSNVGFSSYTPEGGDGVSTFGLDVTGGYFVIDNMAVGATLGFTSSDGSSNSTYGIGARYYMNSIFAHVAYNMGSSKSDVTITTIDPITLAVTTSTESVSVSSSSMVVGAGYAMMLSDNVALEPMLSYTMDSVEGESIGSGFGLSIGFGLYF